jgi:hypothetical protein
LGGKRVAQYGYGATRWFHTDHLGSTRVLSDSTGALVSSANQDLGWVPLYQHGIRHGQ